MYMYMYLLRSSALDTSSMVTSLLCYNNVLYIGTEGGVMLALNPVDLTALWSVTASKTPIRCITGTPLDTQDLKRRSHHSLAFIVICDYIIFKLSEHRVVVIHADHLPLNNGVPMASKAPIRASIIMFLFHNSINAYKNHNPV